MAAETMPVAERRGRGGRPLTRPERGRACRHVAIRMWPDEVELLLHLGDGSLAEGFHQLVLLHRTPPADAGVGSSVAQNRSNVAQNTEQQEQEAPVGRRVRRVQPAQPVQHPAAISVPPATRRPASLTAWDDDE
jgi:hypothetical protein